VGHMPLVLRELLEHRQLIRLLESSEADRVRTRLRGYDEDLRLCPTGRGDRCHALRDARPVLAGDDAEAPGRAGITIGHMCCSLLMDHRDEIDAGGSEDVHRIHECRAHDPEDVRDTVIHHRLDEGLGGGALLGLHCIAQRCLIGSIGQFRHRNVSCSSWTTALWSRFSVHFTSKSGTPRIYERSPEVSIEFRKRFRLVRYFETM